MTHYITLGVSETASPDDIKQSYRKLASVHHPDKGGDTARFQEIQSAYEVLSNPDKRAQYDQRNNPQNGFRFNFNGRDVTGDPNMDDIFRNFGFFGHGNQQPRRNADTEIRINMSLESTLQDQSITVTVRTGNGTRDTLEVKIPRGVVNGSAIRYPKLGDNVIESLPRGDLYVHAIVDAHPKFEVQNNDLVTDLNVDCLTAMTGGEVEVHGLDDRVFKINIPAGSQHNTGFRIHGQGLWQLNSLTRGNLIVKMYITVPQNLTDDQKVLINQLKQSL